MPGYTEFGKRLRGWREGRGLSQESLGEKLGVERLTVTRWENGQTFPPPKTMQRIAELTEKPLAWFFQVEGEGAEPPAEVKSGRGRRSRSQGSDELAAAVEQAITPLREDLRRALEDQAETNRLLRKALASCAASGTAAPSEDDDVCPSQAIARTVAAQLEHLLASTPVVEVATEERLRQALGLLYEVAQAKAG